MKKTLIIAIGIIIVTAVGFFAWQVINIEPQYKSVNLGISFRYSGNYLVREETLGTGERNRYAIVLIEDTPGNRDILEGKIKDTEGPPTITVSIFQNNLDDYTAESFVKGTSFSNFKLSDGKLAETAVAGEPALRYRATGLYENENVVVARPDFVYMFTVFFNSPADPILSDFEKVLKSARFISE